MRKLWMLVTIIISIGVFTCYAISGTDKITNHLPSAEIPDGGILIYLLVPDDKDEFKLPAEMLIIDQKGRKTGKDLTRSYDEMPNASYTIREAKDMADWIKNDYVEPLFDMGVMAAEGSIYRLQVIGKKDGSYNLSIHIFRNKGDRKSKEQDFDNVKIREGEIHNYTLKFSLTSSMEIKRVD